MEDVMKEQDRMKIEEIMQGMQCPKNFKCADSGFEGLCKAKDFGLETYLECLEENPGNCSFALSFGYSYFFCECPLRVFLGKKLKKLEH
jgi:hypothetical protein